ncbi:hypothetical protein NCC78_21140 [Micromonospora phytophila]|uniref:hypothetical protein n=1 Tax=Micromonospora phytophila TaxID=709888 RepID=UPI0020309897|nr:hypothetical protein [Micromonospora phytophila]MCM0677175.1 hypothetical protein [Micromonospora phytophila]
MGEVLPMPSFGDLFTDVRGSDRTMRVSWHPERDAVVLSLWAGTVCRGSFRMAVDDLPALLALLTEITGAAAVGAPEGSPPDGSDPRATGATVARAPVASPVEQTGEITGSAHRGLLPIVPAPRVA